MATLREIRRRISGVKSTQKITKAMKMVAAAKLRRSQDAVISARPYARKMKELLQQLAAVVDVTAQPLFATREVKNVAIIVVTADRGLCGAFNANIIRATVHHIRDNYAQLHAAGNVKLIVIGKKGHDYFFKNEYHIDEKHLGIFSELNFSKAQEIARDFVRRYLRGEYDRVEIIYNEFKSIIHQHLVIEQLLPIPEHTVTQPSANNAGQPAPAGESHAGGEAGVDYIYEPSGDEIIAALLPKHINFQIWKALLESNASEQGARMTAMDNATTNASDLIRDLQLSYNNARQASITKELLEIVSGAEALKQAS
jgi:F-type H+-transporting ATPase subunit gamma